MGLEIPTYISDLVATNPLSTDLKSLGDDHLRAIKTVLRNTFPNADKAFYLPDFGTKAANFSVLATELNKTFLVSTAGGNVTGTLPVLTSADDGWTCHFLKTGTNVLFIAPASGTLQSGEITGLAKCRRCIPGHRSTAIWTGTEWIVTRVPSVPIGTELEFVGSSLPTGYEWPNGDTLASASTNYPEYNSLIGSGLTPDSRGRVTAGNDTMGGSSANRLTAVIDGDIDWNAGGSDTRTLVQGHLPSATLTTTVTNNFVDGIHSHTNSAYYRVTGYISGQVPTSPANHLYCVTDSNTVPDTGSSASGSSSSVTASTALGGSNQAFGLLQPTIVKKKMLVVE